MTLEKRVKHLEIKYTTLYNAYYAANVRRKKDHYDRMQRLRERENIFAKRWPVFMRMARKLRKLDRFLRA